MLHHPNLHFIYPKWSGIPGVQHGISSGSWINIELGIQLVIFLKPGKGGLHKHYTLWLCSSSSKQS